MFKRIVNAVEVLVLAAVVAFVVVAVAYRPARTTYPPAAAGASGIGRQIFASHCASCHGDRGEGAIGPRLAGSVKLLFPNVDNEISVVTNGRDGMPAWGTRLSPAEIDAVVNYTRQL